MRGNQSELPLVLKSPQCHLNTLLVTNWPQKTVTISNTNTGLIKKIWYMRNESILYHHIPWLALDIQMGQDSQIHLHHHPQSLQMTLIHPLTCLPSEVEWGQL